MPDPASEPPPGREGLRWQVIGIVVAAVLAVIGIIVSIVLHAAPSPTSPAQVSVRGFDTRAVVPTEFDPSELGEPDPAQTYQVPAVVVDLVNKGAEPALITAVDLRLRYAAKLEPCEGAGDQQITGHYLVGLPQDLPPLPWTSPANPIGFSINPTSNDRLAVTVGPQGPTWAAEAAWVYTFDLALSSPDSADPINVGTVEMISAPSYKIDEVVGGARPDADQGCLQRNLDTLTGAVVPGGQPSDAFTRLEGAYSRALGR